MRIVRTEEDVKRRQAFIDAKRVKLRALSRLDRQNLPPDKKCYNADAEEASIFLDAGADILEYRHREKYTFLRLMYEGVPIKYEAQNEFTHPRLQ
jgi:hypothetical protein